MDERHRLFTAIIILLALYRIILPAWVILLYVIIDAILFIIEIEIMFKDINKELGE